MILNFTTVTTLVSELNCSIIGWFYTAKNTSRRDAVYDQQSKSNQAGGMFGLLVSGDAANRR
jgi:hypothetical protein